MDRLEGKLLGFFCNPNAVLFNTFFIDFFVLTRLVFDRLSAFIPDELRAEQERNKMLQEDMEATLQDIQNM